MRSIVLLTIVIGGLVIAVVLLLLAVGVFSPRNITEQDLPPVREAVVEAVAVEAGGAEPLPAATQPVEIQDAATPDAASLLKERCSACHPVFFIEMMQKPRTEWEAVLAKMEKAGVNLKDSERTILLDYLADTD